MTAISQSADSVEPRVHTNASADGTGAVSTRRARIRTRATARGIPLAAILTAVGVVAPDLPGRQAPLPAAGRRPADGGGGGSCLDPPPPRALPPAPTPQ